MPEADVESLRLKIRAFAEERLWQPFHTPKNLSMALSVEASELMEHFQWLTAEQSANLDAEKRRAVAEEMADVLIYLVRLADVLDISLLDAAETKLRINANRYPAEHARGRSEKYTAYIDSDRN
jgi:NTP pyrophosphatase (non-canonical NTP hydrolase)